MATKQRDKQNQTAGLQNEEGYNGGSGSFSQGDATERENRQGPKMNDDPADDESSEIESDSPEEMETTDTDDLEVETDDAEIDGEDLDSELDEEEEGDETGTQTDKPDEDR